MNELYHNPQAVLFLLRHRDLYRIGRAAFLVGLYPFPDRLLDVICRRRN